MATSFNLRDSAGVTWQITVSSLGLLGSSPVANGPIFTDVFLAQGSNTHYVLGVTTLGLITATVTALTADRVFLTLSATACAGFWDLGLDSQGRLFTTPTPGVPIDPVLGQLVINPSAEVTAKQPNGIGTPVTDPVQAQNAMVGRQRPGCGHSVNSFDIGRQQICGIPSGVVRCPACGYVVRIITPYTDVYAEANAYF